MKSELVKRIEQRMHELDMNKSELAKTTGIRASSISDYLNGRYAPKQDKIAAIADALKVSPSWLLGIESNEGYYTDPETAAYAEELRTNPEMRMLFSAAKDISKESMKKTYEYIKFLKMQEEGNDD